MAEQRGKHGGGGLDESWWDNLSFCFSLVKSKPETVLLLAKEQ